MQPLRVLIVLLLTLAPTFLPRMTFGRTVKNLATSDWGGYLVDYSNNTSEQVSDVLGAWIVPAVSASLNQSAVLESVGIGLAQSTGIEIGTSQVSISGVVKYRAFYATSEDNNPTVISQLTGDVGPGTFVVAELGKTAGDSWTIILVAGASNGSSPNTFSMSVPHSGSQLSADWFVRTPPGYPLGGFDFVPFISANATVNGVRYGLDALPNEKINLYDPSLACQLSLTSRVGLRGDDFNVTFLQSGPPCQVESVPPPPVNFGYILAVGGLAIGLPAAAIVAAVMFASRRKKIGQGTGPTPPPSAGPAMAPVYCTNCGSVLRPNAQFCGACGTQRRV